MVTLSLESFVSKGGNLRKKRQTKDKKITIYSGVRVKLSICRMWKSFWEFFCIIFRKYILQLPAKKMFAKIRWKISGNEKFSKNN